MAESRTRVGISAVGGGRRWLTETPLRIRLLLAGLPFAGGAALVIHILTDYSLPLGILGLGAIGLMIWIVLVPRLHPSARQRLRQRALVGCVAGLLGTVAYDVARYGTVALFSLSFQPFHVLGVFGEALIGSGRDPALTFAVGALYHLSNGTFFGLAYTLVFRSPRWWTGALWGCGLELCMATLYPSWLRIQAFGEFLHVSAVGHLVYGTTLGLLAGYGIRRFITPGPRS